MDLLEDLLKNIADCLDCSICQEIFTYPVTLPCGHSYCQKCISGYAKAKKSIKMDCPKCRNTFRRDMQLKKNVTLCEMTKLYHDCKHLLSNEESTGPQMETEVREVALQTSASLEDPLESHTSPEQVEAPDSGFQPSTDSESTLDPDLPNSTLPELPISPSTHRPRAQDFPPPCDASFARLTLTPALGHRRLVWDGHKVSTRRTGRNHGDRFSISQCMAEQEYRQGCHYWDVDTSESVGGAVGVAYAGIGREEQVGRTVTSWCVEWSTDGFSYWHDNMEEPLQHGRPDLVRVVLDMTGGILSFYSLSSSQTLLHRVQESFSGSIRPVFWLFGLKVPNALSFPGNQGL